MKKLTLALIALVFAAGCAKSSSDTANTPKPNNHSWAKANNGETPVLENGVISYSASEAWEVIDTSMTQTWLNYSRFQIGTQTYNGQDTRICLLNNSGHKMFGVGESADRLEAAMWNVMGEPQPNTQVIMSCPTMAVFMAMHPSATTIQAIFDTIN